MSASFLGIDPGKSGAIACVDERGEVLWSERTPLIGKEFDLPQMAELIRDAAPRFCLIEKVSAMPGQGVTGMFHFGEGYGMWQGILTALAVPYAAIHPKEWHRAVGLSLPAKTPGMSPGARTAEIKAATVAQALRRWPGLAVDLKHKADWGRADAMFLAYAAGESSANRWAG